MPTAKANPPPPPTKASPAHSALFIRRGFELLQRLGRGGVINAARAGSDRDWLRNVFDLADRGSVQVLGAFVIKLELARDQVRVPAVLLLVTRDRLGAQLPERAAVVRVYQHPDGNVRASASGTRGTKAEAWGAVPWGAYCGDAGGPPSVLNGDEPRSSLGSPPAPASSTIPSAHASTPLGLRPGVQRVLRASPLRAWQRPRTGRR